MAQDRRQDRHIQRLQHVHQVLECEVCGADLPCPCHTGGRPGRYCSDAHRQLAYRARRDQRGRT